MFEWNHEESKGGGFHFVQQCPECRYPAQNVTSSDCRIAIRAGWLPLRRATGAVLAAGQVHRVHVMFLCTMVELYTAHTRAPVSRPCSCVYASSQVKKIKSTAI